MKPNFIFVSQSLIPDSIPWRVKRQSTSWLCRGLLVTTLGALSTVSAEAQDTACSQGAYSASLIYHGSQSANGLRFDVAGPERVGDMYLGSRGPWTESASLAQPDGTRLTVSGSALSQGQNARVAFCSTVATSILSLPAVTTPSFGP